jgi:aldo/keto reductase family protein
MNTSEPPEDQKGSGQSQNPVFERLMISAAKTARSAQSSRGRGLGPAIDAVVRIAREIGATPSQVALRWLADRPAVIAPIVGASSVEQLKENLGTVDLQLDADAIAALSRVSAPTAGGYPYGAFGNGQRSRSIDGSNAQADLIGGGSDAPTGRN